MTTVKNKRKLFLLLLLCSLITVFLTSCAKKGRLDEGDCSLTVSFRDIPKEFFMMNENLQKEFTIHVTLQNTATEKLYNIVLNRDNDYSIQAQLNPGVYRVLGAYSEMQAFNGIRVAAGAEQLELTRDTGSELHIFVENSAEFTRRWMETQPMPEMLLAEKFSRLIQVNRKVVPLSEIVGELSLTYENGGSQEVAPYGKITLKDNELGISVTLQNRTENPISFKRCDVTALEVFKNTVVFPEGVTLGMTPAQVCHAQTGLYGSPQRFKGTILFGWDFDRTSAVYLDEQSGDRITITFSPDGSYIQSICYEPEQFE